MKKKNAVAMPYAKKGETAATIFMKPVLLNYAQLIAYIRNAIILGTNLVIR